MIRHHEYLVYPSQCFTVTFEGEPGKGATARQRWQVTIESATRGKPRAVERREATATLTGVKGFIKGLLDPEYGDGRWERFSLTTNPDGTISGGRFGLIAAVNQLIEECGIPLARGQLENGKEPEIVALCGGLENALRVFAHCAKLRARDEA